MALLVLYFVPFNFTANSVRVRDSPFIAISGQQTHRDEIAMMQLN